MINAVISKASRARWALDNVDAYIRPSTGEIAVEHESEVQAWMLVAMGQPICGELTGRRGVDGSYHVIWYSPFGTFTGYYDRNEFTAL